MTRDLHDQRQQPKTALREVVRVVLTVLAVDAILMLMIAATYAIPNQPIIDHLRADVAAGRLAEDYPSNALGGSLDGYTQCLGTTIGVIPSTADSNSFRNVSLIPRGPGGCENVGQFLDEVEAAEQAGTQSIAPAGAYIRYWAGFSIFSRPLLALGGLTAVKIFTGLALLSSAVVLAWGASKRLGPATGIALVGVYFAVTNVLGNVSAFTQGIAEAVLLAGAAAVFLVPKKWRYAAAAAAASVFVVIDLLTVPSSSAALVVFALMARSWAESRERGEVPQVQSLLKTGVLGGLTWLGAYAFTWGLRWIVAVPTMGWTTVMDNVVTTARFRIDGGVTSTGVVVNVSNIPGASVARAVKEWLVYGGPQVALILLLIALVLAASQWATVRRGGGLPVMASLMAPALIVPLWYEVLRNHSQIHTFFTHRSLGIAAAIVIATLVMMALAPQRQPEPADKE